MNIDENIAKTISKTTNSTESCRKNNYTFFLLTMKQYPAVTLNNQIKQEAFPHQLKIATITTVFKSGSQLLPNKLSLNICAFTICINI